MDSIILLFSILIVFLADIILKITYKIYKKKQSNSDMTGYEVAKKILHENDLDNIDVGRVSGNLTDHYNNSKQVINLSSDIYEGTSIASLAVAAHECGHAVQYKEGYFPIRVRNTLVPIVNIGNKLGYIAIVISLFASISALFIVGIILISFALVFQLITLPVEFNASKRAKKILYDMGIVDNGERYGVAVMLYAAAFTYVAGLISSILEILRLVLRFSRRRN